MSAYYNEIDPFAAQWLRELIKQGHITDGVVDERSIEDVRPDELKQYTQCHFFAGIGVWSYALRQAGWPDDRPVWTGSCPCQPFSSAGKGAGFDDERHLWPAFYWLIEKCLPGVVFGEQVAGKAAASWSDCVSNDLEKSGYAFGRVVFPACSIGAPHMRRRTYWIAHTEGERWQRSITHDRMPRLTEKTHTEYGNNFTHARRALECGKSGILQRDGTTVGLERLRIKGYGNAIVAPQAQAFIEAYMSIEEQEQ